MFDSDLNSWISLQEQIVCVCARWKGDGEMVLFLLSFLFFYPRALLLLAAGVWRLLLAQYSHWLWVWITLPEALWWITYVNSVNTHTHKHTNTIFAEFVNRFVAGEDDENRIENYQQEKKWFWYHLFPIIVKFILFIYKFFFFSFFANPLPVSHTHLFFPCVKSVIT